MGRVRRMGRRDSLIPSERQLQAMSVLWTRGSGTVSEVMGEINDTWEPELAHNTVLTYLTILKRKGWVTVQREGAADRYYPKAALEQTRWLQLERITDLLFSGSRDKLLDYLVYDKFTSRRTLKALAREVARRLTEMPASALPMGRTAAAPTALPLARTAATGRPGAG